MTHGFDAIVIGSGYGGGVAACRLARAGLKVAVLERGREWRVGEFPRNLSELARAFRVSAARFSRGSAHALFDYRVNDDVDVLVGCGLGGTSLINANVCLKPDPRIFDDPRWPDEVRSDGLLAEGYARARTVLKPAPCPQKPELTKLTALAHSANALGTGVVNVPLHITFEDRANYANVLQPACTLCGDCCGGCNVGAKTTVALSYLADAARHGAAIYTSCLVRSVAMAPDGAWTVHYRRQDIAPGRGAAPSWEDDEAPEDKLSAPLVIVAAGTLGTSEILLRSRKRGLALSDRLGEGFTANGDCLAVAYNGEVAVNNIGVGDPPRANTDPVGPAVAGLIDLRSDRPCEDGVALVEAALPSAMAALAPAMFASGNLPFGTDYDRGLGDEAGEFWRGLESVLGGAYTGAVRNSQTLLGVGNDSADGRLELVGDHLRIAWPKAGRHPIYEKIDAAFATSTRALGASLLKNPMSLPALGNKLTTVHPLGGCVMAASKNEGVIDHRCRVFDGRPSAGPRNVYTGLYVCDGSIMPRSLGIHPLFTITAFAERAMLLLARERGWEMPLQDNRDGAAYRIERVGPRKRPGALTRIRNAFSGMRRKGRTPA